MTTLTDIQAYEADLLNPHGEPFREVRIAWTVVAEVANDITGESDWLRNDIIAGDDPQHDAASPVWDLLESKGYTVLGTVACPTEFACPACGADTTSPNHGNYVPCS